jgi:ribosome-associated heat shock protein Hsp15
LKPKTENRDDAGDAAMRLDKLLWYLRLAPTRGAAQAMVAAGTIRIDGRRADRASIAARVGSLLVLPGPPRVRVLRLVHLPLRRGPPSEAACCYVDIASDAGAAQEFAPPA